MEDGPPSPTVLTASAARPASASRDSFTTPRGGDLLLRGLLARPLSPHPVGRPPVAARSTINVQTMTSQVDGLLAAARIGSRATSAALSRAWPALRGELPFGVRDIQAIRNLGWASPKAGPCSAPYLRRHT